NQNDTALDVKFLRPYSGYLYASFGGCQLRDSLLLQINAAKPSISLGNDTMLCPGQLLTLNVPAGYRNYQWQDGSNNTSVNAINDGQYFIKVTDSCGNVSRDTVIVNKLKNSLYLPASTPLCLNDTALINLPVIFSNYVLQPLNSGTIINNQLRLYPLINTTYILNATAFPGCILSDTFMILVKHCSNIMWFPSAFTPNEDGINDQFRPTADGHLVNYQFSIYNRWGQIMFKTNSINQGWNGRKQGLSQNTGGYIWICNYQFANLPPARKKGNFLLIK
ncbi:MAG TPA: gliding motility-associated C-terminal domain-containing protein, partial [Ferruginibacter sp.]|nr:gliding motility-associated C-terminal domain-containing protein [Ferruginibacter sp.]